MKRAYLLIMTWLRFRGEPEQKAQNVPASRGRIQDLIGTCTFRSSSSLAGSADRRHLGAPQLVAEPPTLEGGAVPAVPIIEEDVDGLLPGHRVLLEELPPVVAPDLQVSPAHRGDGCGKAVRTGGRDGDVGGGVLAAAPRPSTPRPVGIDSSWAIRPGFELRHHNQSTVCQRP